MNYSHQIIAQTFANETGSNIDTIKRNLPQDVRAANAMLDIYIVTSPHQSTLLNAFLKVLSWPSKVMFNTNPDSTPNCAQTIRQIVTTKTAPRA